MVSQPLRPVPPEAARSILAETSQLCIFQVDRDGRILGWNLGAAEMFTAANREPGSIREVLVSHEAERVGELLASAATPAPREMDFVDPDLHTFTLRCRFYRDGDVLTVVGERDPGDGADFGRTLMEVNQELAVLTREHSRRSRELTETRDALERTLAELQATHWHLKKVREVISVCMHCGKIRADEANWETLQDYLLKNEVLLSHGTCPECTAAWELRLEDELKNL